METFMHVQVSESVLISTECALRTQNPLSLPQVTNVACSKLSIRLFTQCPIQAPLSVSNFLFLNGSLLPLSFILHTETL